MIEVQDLHVTFKKPQGILDWLGRRPPVAVRAVDGVDLSIGRGETLGLVGESGSGKTTVGRAILRLYEPTAGRVLVEGRDISGLAGPAELAFRRACQMVFQDPYGSLNPRLRFHEVVPAAEVAAEVRRLMTLVGLGAEQAGRLPRALSGGQRQRVGLARALAVRPRFLVLDEPVAALDVSIQAQVLNLLQDLRDELGLTMLLVAHELGVVRHMAHRIAVMYLGRVVEVGRTDEIFGQPRHPYTQGLLRAVPRHLPVKRDRRPVLEGEIPSPLALPSGCRFRTRCPRAAPVCAQVDPPPVRLSATHAAHCHFADETDQTPGDGTPCATPSLPCPA